MTMKKALLHRAKWAVTFAVGLSGALSVGAADARGWGHGPRVGVYIGAPLAFGYRPYPYYWGPPAYSYYYPPAYYAPVVPVAPVAPVTPQYVEKGDDPAAAGTTALEPGYWYYCRNPQGYYPSVAQCAGGWEKVAPQPPSAPPAQQ